MSREKRLVPQSFGDGDYSLVRATVDKYPQSLIKIDCDNTLKHVAIESENTIRIDTYLLCDGRGRNVVPANLFLRHKARHTIDTKTLKDYAQALLAFYRYMSIYDKTIFDVTAVKENGVIYKFRDFLRENLKREEEGNISGIYSPRTAANYVLKIVSYFNFLNAARIIEINENFVPFEYKVKSIQKRKLKNRDHRILGYLERKTAEISVLTTGLTAPFGKKQSLPSHKELSPMVENDQRIFLETLGDNTNDLMLRLALETGLRLEEFCTFPESEVIDPLAKIVQCTISEVRNGCLTKFNKERTIEVPYDLMVALNQYRLGKARINARSRCLFSHSCLFIKRDGYPYSTNSLEKHFSKIRDKIREKNPDWYYTIHDLRATFATNWLYRKYLKTGMPFDSLLEDLKSIMGHNDTSSTEKYVKYMNADDNWFKFSRSQNEKAAELYKPKEM